MSIKMTLAAVVFAGGLMLAGSQGSAGAEEAGTAATAKTETVTLNVKGMMCNGCENAVSATLKKAPGVTDAKADNTKGIAVVTYDPTKTTPEDLAKTLTGKFSAEAPKKG